MEFKKWFEDATLGTDLVVSQIDNIYDKAKISIQLVKMYSREMGLNLLKNISTIANLTHGAYGLYNSAYNKKVISQKAIQKIRFKFGENIIKNNDIFKVPEVVIRKYIPDIQDSEIQQSDVIYINVNRIISELGDSPAAILEIASTIVHEATHEKEREEKGVTSEILPQAEEKKFINWFKVNKNRIIQKFPQLKQ